MGYIKVIQSLRRIETFQYERFPQTGRAFGKRDAPNPYRKMLGRRRDNALRAREDFRRLVSANLDGVASPSFLTLTFASDISLSEAYKNLKRFFEHLRRTRYSNVRYIAVVEWQRRGVPHFHILIWGVPSYVVQEERSTRNLQRIWLRGYLDIRPSDGSPKLATYMAKYLFKALSDKRYGHRKAYSASRNVMRPVLYKNGEAANYMDLMQLSTLDPLQEKEYKTQYLGRANYKQYDI